MSADWTGAIGKWRSLLLLFLQLCLDRFRLCDDIDANWGPDSGFFWNMFMIDSQNLYFVASWDTAQMNDIEVEDFCECMADTMRKMAKPDNWNKTIGQLFGP